MMKSLLLALLTTTLTLAPVSAATAPPLRQGTTAYYTLEQQQSPEFQACLRAGGIDHLYTGKELRTASPAVVRQWKAVYWPCFHRLLEPNPDRVEHDWYCVVDGAVRPNEECEGGR